MADPDNKMTESELAALVSRLEKDAITHFDSEIANDTAKAMEYYLGEKYGNEDPNCSQVVTREVTEAVEFAMPYLVKTFFSTDAPVRFQPETLQDIAAAEQATDYTNYVFNRQNPGFKIGYQWLKDALIQKYGVIKAYWDDNTQEEVLTIKDLSDEEIEALLLDDDVLEVTEDTVFAESEDDEAPIVGRETKFKVQNPGGQVRIENIPPEEFLVTAGTKCLRTSDYVAHKTTKRMSELRAMGFDLSDVEHELSHQDSDAYSAPQYVVRHNQDDDGKEVGDRPMSKNDKEVTVLESYIRIDFDGDGLTELRKVVTVGKHVLQNDEVDGNPFYGWTPVILSHKLHGLSYSDLIMDLQIIKSTIVRSMLDNMYIANHGRHKVIENRVNIEDLLSSRANGVVRVKDMNALERLDHPEISPNAFSLLGYIDQMTFNRTGMNERSRGTDGDLLNSNIPISNMNQIMSAADQRIELVARVFAETGFKELMLGIYDLVIKNERKTQVVKLRDEFVEINPMTWIERKDATAEVGLGNNNRDQDMVHLGNIANMQDRIVAGGGLGTLVTPKNIYNLSTEFVKTSGRKDADLYFTDPGEIKGNEPEPPSVEDQVKMAKAQAEAAEVQVKQLEAQIKAQELELEKARLAFEVQKHEDDNEFRLAELELEARQGRAVKVGND